MKKVLCRAIMMLSKYFAIGFMVQLLVFSTLFGKDVEAQLSSTIPDNLQQVTVEKVIHILSKRAHVTFVYDTKDINNEKKVSFSGKHLDAGEVLDRLSKKLGVTYKKIGHTITLKKKKEAIPLTSLQSFSAPTSMNYGFFTLELNDAIPQKEIRVSGIVTDSIGNKLIGVTVQVKGTSKGTSTDAQGHYRLTVLENDTLVFSYVGYDSRQIAVNGKEQINVVLSNATSGLGEVVVVGFGKQKKMDMVSAISTITTKDLNVNPVRNTENMLQGKIAGVLAIQRSGEPGYDDPSFWIRGISSFAGGTNPLIIVDGVPRNSFSNIDPNEIASLSILKDATATAVYGAEGANGVILITTKRGAVQKTKITYRGEYSYSVPLKMPKFLGSADYLDLYNESLENSGQKAIFSQELIKLYRNHVDPDLYPDNHWPQQLLRNHTSNTSHNLTFRGGSEKARYFVSGSYYHEDGLFKQNPLADYNNNIGLDRYNLRSNIDLDVTNSTLISINLAGQYLETNYPGTGTNQILQSITRTPPYLYPDKFSNGKLAGPYNPSGNRQNPYNLLMESGYSNEYRTSLESVVTIDQKLDFLTKGLSAKARMSFNFDGNFYTSRAKDISTYYATGRDISGDLTLNKATSGSGNLGDPSNSNNASKDIYLEGSLNYNRTFHKVHHITGLLLTFQHEVQAQNNIGLPFHTRGYVGRLTYTYADRYSLETNFGITGSEAFAKGHRYGFFPSFGVAWNVSNEPYYPSSLEDVVSHLKFRYTMGKTGNDKTGGSRFLFIGTFEDGPGFNLGYGQSSALNGYNGLVEGRFDAPALSWEVQKEKNFGLDLGLFNDAINLTADYFSSMRSSILLQRRTVSGVAGFKQSPWQNYGKVSNKGVDLSLEINKQISNNSVITIRGNFTYAKNKIVEYDEIPQKYSWMDITGTSVGTPNIYIAEGLYTEDDFDITKDDNGEKEYTLKDGLPVSSLSSPVRPGDIKYKDLNGDGVIDQFDQTRNYKGAYPNSPEINYGFGVNYSYKGFYAGVYFIGVGNTSIFLNGYEQGFIPFQWGLEESSIRKAVLNRWKTSNPKQDVLYPRIHSNSFYNNTAASTWWLRDASFIRLKNAQIGYNVSSKLLERWTGGAVSSARIYLLGYNLLTWSKIKLWDPEQGSGSAGFQYPQTISYTLGLQISL